MMFPDVWPRVIENGGVNGDHDPKGFLNGFQWFFIRRTGCVGCSSLRHRPKPVAGGYPAPDPRHPGDPPRHIVLARGDQRPRIPPGAQKNYAKDLSDLVDHVEEEEVPEIPTSTICLTAEARPGIEGRKSIFSSCFPSPPSLPAFAERAIFQKGGACASLSLFLLKEGDVWRR